MKKIYITICILSFVILFSAACQADAGALALDEVVRRCVQGLSGLLFGLGGLYRWESRARELRRRAARRADMRAAYEAPIAYDERPARALPAPRRTAA